MTAPERLSDTAAWGDWFERAMNQPGPNLDNVVNPDVIGAYGLEYDGPCCAEDDCRQPVPDDGELCDGCTADQDVA